MSVFYGSDSNCVTDVGLFDLQITDPIILIGQRIARRLTTPRGALAAIGDDPEFGWDVRQYTLGRLAPTQIDQAQRQIAAECLKDEQVQSAIVSISFVSGGALTIKIDMVASVGPFQLTLNVNQLTVSAVFGF
jgi:hypothetical protein